MVFGGGVITLSAEVDEGPIGAAMFCVLVVELGTEAKAKRRQRLVSLLQQVVKSRF